MFLLTFYMINIYILCAQNVAIFNTIVWTLFDLFQLLVMADTICNLNK